MRPIPPPNLSRVRLHINAPTCDLVTPLRFKSRVKNVELGMSSTVPARLRRGVWPSRPYFNPIHPRSGKAEPANSSRKTAGIAV